MPFRHVDFDSDALKIATAAFDAACALRFNTTENERTLMAARIIDLMLKGERDLERLKESALAAIA